MYSNNNENYDVNITYIYIHTYVHICMYVFELNVIKSNSSDIKFKYIHNIHKRFKY